MDPMREKNGAFSLDLKGKLEKKEVLVLFPGHSQVCFSSSALHRASVVDDSRSCVTGLGHMDPRVCDQCHRSSGRIISSRV